VTTSRVLRTGCVCASVLILAAAFLPRPVGTVPGGPRIELGEPKVVAQGPPGEKRWGYYQFPSLDRWADGRIMLRFHVNPDAAESYGKRSSAPDTYVSADGAATWNAHTGALGAGGLLLANGDRIRVHTFEAIPVSQLNLPAPVGTHVDSYGNIAYTLYRIRELPAALQGVYLTRMATGAAGWQLEHDVLNDPLALRYSLRGILPVVWWGDIRIAPDRSLIAGMYPGYMEGQESFPSNIFFYRSSDSGKTWDVLGRLLYQPDVEADPKGKERSGFTEPTFVFLDDGSLLCVARTLDGLGPGPMYLSRSNDGGRNWSRPSAFAPTGVMPRLLRLGNGTLVLSSGRPGVELRFSFDGRGESWTQPTVLVPMDSAKLAAESCGYTDLLAVDSNSFLIAYSWFRARDAQGLERKSILVRRITVR
jgi:hypothetical protein